MRNLQKILALVLALIMSFSLVATAGAFSDDGDISDAYKDAVTVLNGLEVFKGYDNGATFQPKGNITRAEVAAIIYRIATGDVKDTQASIYSTYGQFTDVLDGSWYAGYVNYCANAGYIKGRGNKIFDPQATVTGYEALAMILRAVGYDKNGEFTGSNWQIRTASIANERGISKNVTSAMLGQAATREVVAELLFRSIIIPKVNFNANTLSYTEKPLNADGKKDTLGYESLKLEEITGIVTANEYADLEKSITLNDGKTRMRVDGVDGQDYILDYTEENLLDGLDAIGEEHNAYIQNANTTSAKVLVMAKTDNNKTYETLEEVEIDTDSKFREKTGFQRSASATEDFLNFDEVNEWHSDWRIKYVVSSVDSVVRGDVETQIKRINTLTNFELPSTLGAELATPLTFANGYRLIQDGTTDKYFIEYTKEFRIDEVINSIHRGNIEEIFNIADKLHANDYVRGEVYVGTSSLKDISDEISFKQFVEQYIDTTEAKVTKNENGNWLKVIDNDNDGQAEYVLKIVYTMAQVVRAKDGKYGLDTEDVVLCNSKKGADDAVNFIDDDDVRSEDTLALDDIVYYAVIDDKAWATKAEIANVKIDVVNRKDLKVTTTDGTEYVESGVCEEIVSNDYNSGVTNMNGSATYDIYLDRGGFLAAFTDSNGGDFTLIVDGWYNNTKNGVEYAVRAYNDETNRQDMIDVTRGGSMFIGDVQWDKHNVQNNAWNALKWLGGVTAAKANDGALDNNPAGQLNGESGIQANEDVKTTVATLTGDGMLLPVDYASTGTARTDKVVRMLAPKNNAIPTSAASYNAEVYRTSDSLGITDTAYDAADGTAELRALSSTTYYLVYPSGNAESGFVVERYVGYANVPSIDDGFVEDVYAVGTRQNRVSTLGADSYFTANVVVVELNANYRGKQEQVFIYNMPEAGSRVGIESVDLIRENGNTETVKVDFEKSTIRDYRPAWDANVGWTGSWAPGLYFLYTTGTEGLYTVQPMTPADIAANDYVVGWSATAQGTLKNDYVSVVAFDNTNTAYGLVEKAAAGNKIFTLDYNSRGIADLGTYAATDGNIQRYLGERADETTERNSAREHTPFDGHGCTTYWNQNRVLIHYDGDDAVYAISFKSTNNLANAVFNASKPSAAVWQGTSSRDDAISYANFMVDTVEKVGLDNAVFPTYGIGKADLEALRDTLNNVRKVDDPAIDALIARIDAIIGGVIPPIDEFSVQVIAADGTDITATAAVVTDETDTSATVTLTIPEGQEIDTATLNGAAVAVTAGVNSITGLTKDVEDKLVVTLKDSSVVPAEFTLTFDEKLKEGTFDVTVNGELAADGAGIKTGDIIVLNPAAVLTATGIDETGAVTGDVTVSIKDGFTYSSMFGGWMGVNDAGDLITVPYDPTVAAAGMRARAATDDSIVLGPVDTTEEGWFGKVVRDYGATYTITVGNVVWEGKIAQGGTTWKLKQGTVDEAKAAIASIDSAVVEKIQMAEPETVAVKVAAKDAAQVILGKATVDGTELTAGEDGSYSVDTGKTLVVDFTLGSSIAAADVGSVVAYPVVNGSVGTEVAATAKLNSTKTGGSFEFAVTAAAEYQIVFNKAVNITFSFANTSTWADKVKDVRVDNVIQIPSEGRYTIQAGTEITVNATTTTASPANKTLYLIAKTASGTVVAAEPVVNGAAALIWNVGTVDNVRYTVTTGYDELARTPQATTDGMKLSVMSSDFSGQGVAYIDLRELNYDNPTKLEDLQKYLQTQTGKKIEIQYATAKDASLPRIELGDQVFTPDVGENEQRANHLGVIYAKVAGKDVKIYVNNQYAGFQVLYNEESLGLFQNGTRLTITDGTLTYTDPVTKQEIIRTLNGSHFTVKVGETFVYDGDADGLLDEGAGLAARYIEVPDKGDRYTVVMNSQPIVIMDDYWSYDCSTVGANPSANAGPFYARKGETVDLGELDSTARGGVIVQKVVNGVLDTKADPIPVSGSNPDFTFVMPGHDVKVTDQQATWTVKVDGKDVTTGVDGKLDKKVTKDLTGFVVITKVDSKGNTKYYDGTMTAGKMDEVLSSDDDRFVPISVLKNTQFDDNGYSVETGYYRWFVDSNSNNEYNDGVDTTKGFAKAGSTVYLTKDGTSETRPVTTSDAIAVMKMTDKTDVATSGENDKSNPFNFVMPASETMIKEDAYWLNIVGKVGSVSGTTTTIKDVNKKVIVAESGGQYKLTGGASGDIPDAPTDMSWGTHVTITTGTGSKETFWKGTATPTQATGVNDRFIQIARSGNLADFNFYVDSDGSGTKTEDDLYPKDFTVHVGYYPVNLKDSSSTETDCVISGDYGQFTAAGAGADALAGYAYAGEVVTVSKTTGTFSGASVVALKTADLPTETVMAAGTPVGAADNAYRFTMPGCGVTISAAGTNKILTVGVKGADLDDLTSVEDITTNKDSHLLVPGNHKWGYYFTITDASGKYHDLGLAGAIDDAQDNDPIWLSVDSQLAGIDWDNQTSGGVDYVDAYTVNVNYFKADFRVADPTIKCEGATVGIKGKDAVEFDKWGTDGVDYVLRGTTLVVTPGVTGNSFAVNGKVIESGGAPLEIVMGNVAEIEISKNESSEPVNGSAVRVAVATDTAGADDTYAANVTDVTITAVATSTGKNGAVVTVTYKDAEDQSQTATGTFNLAKDAAAAAVATALVSGLNDVEALTALFDITVDSTTDTKILFTSKTGVADNKLKITNIEVSGVEAGDSVTFGDPDHTQGASNNDAAAWAGTLTLSQSNGDADVDTVAVINYIEAGERKSAEITFKTGADATATGTNFSTAVASSALNSLFDVTGTSPALTFTAKTAGADKAEIVSVTIQ